MDPTTRYTVQERVKIVEAYFATKSAILTRRQFRRDFPRKKPPSKLTIRRLLENSGKQEVLGIKIKDTVVSHDLLGGFLPGMSLLNCRWVRTTDFVAKYASTIFTLSCTVYRVVGSIDASGWKSKALSMIYLKMREIC